MNTVPQAKQGSLSITFYAMKNMPATLKMLFQFMKRMTTFSKLNMVSGKIVLKIVPRFTFLCPSWSAYQVPWLIFTDRAKSVQLVNIGDK